MMNDEQNIQQGTRNVQFRNEGSSLNIQHW